MPFPASFSGSTMSRLRRLQRRHQTRQQRCDHRECHAEQHDGHIQTNVRLAWDEAVGDEHDQPLQSAVGEQCADDRAGKPEHEGFR